MEARDANKAIGQWQRAEDRKLIAEHERVTQERNEAQREVDVPDQELQELRHITEIQQKQMEFLLDRGGDKLGKEYREAFPITEEDIEWDRNNGPSY